MLKWFYLQDLFVKEPVSLSEILSCNGANGGLEKTIVLAKGHSPNECWGRARSQVSWRILRQFYQVSRHPTFLSLWSAVCIFPWQLLISFIIINIA